MRTLPADRPVGRPARVAGEAAPGRRTGPGAGGPPRPAADPAGALRDPGRGDAPERRRGDQAARPRAGDRPADDGGDAERVGRVGHQEVVGGPRPGSGGPGRPTHSTSQTTTTPRSPPAASRSPSGAYARQKTLPTGQRNVAVSAPVATSHSRTVSSQPPVASVRPSGLNATPVTIPLCPRTASRSCRFAKS